MFHRLIHPIKSDSFFLFGARGTGKTTLLKTIFREDECFRIDLLSSDTEELYAKRPDTLLDIASSKDFDKPWVVIDEIQKIPKLLDIVHLCIEKKLAKFALTGSSARELKIAGANMLAGRAFINHAFPLTHVELGKDFDLERTLMWGALPKSIAAQNDQERAAFLRAYGQTYLKEEVWAEHLIRQLDPFRKFLQVAAQMNGKIINFSNIARDAGVDTKTVQNYFSILDDTLLGFFLEPYNKSLRKRQKQSPKFYFFDLGVVRALSQTLTVQLLPKTYAFGDAFEHFVILELHRLNAYYARDFQFFFVTTKDDAEINLVIERPGQSTLFVEIKSSEHVTAEQLTTLRDFAKDFPSCKAICMSRDLHPRKIGDIAVFPWSEGIKAIFEKSDKE